MAPPKDSNPYDLQATDAKKALSEEGYDDCLACRATGSAAFIGLGVYSYYTGMSNLRKQEQEIMKSATKYKMGSRKLGIFSISATLVGMGVWRAFN
ncbi:hypothetical protein ANI_1_1246014 [Paecilomyces variotii No. 5]|uniref:Distal membrane-arm assembly complex protein 1-like domain-containing protein n=1 Tax=Byssochlamys spectabilis (strain No. 5 / NBRC 109023) TaxID=1356009 RepID=V5G0R7_BYSSN|nr:hypothetical protein ANI_1_1246014 [Paecilomyces variotii No. 5]